INLLYTTLEETLEDGSPGPLLQIPNSLFFQKAVRRWRGPGFSTPTKNGK
ncbi:mechanosensitive ion channel family protein, partial [Klebsiella pneumoniae]